MATIDLGKIKLVWKGTYAAGTAYTPDDVVEYTDTGITSSYICTANSTGNAPSSGGTAHGSWAYMAKGTTGTPTTTRGDIIYRGASADARLAKGSSGQVLTMGANDPSWAAAAGGGKVLQVKQSYTNNEYQVNCGTTPTNWSNLNTSITPTSASSRIIVHVTFGCCQFYVHSALGYGRIVYDKNNGTTWDYADSEPYGANAVAGSAKMQWSVNLEGSDWEAYPVSFCAIYHPNQTSAVNYGVQFWGESTNAVINVNRNSRNNSNDYSASSTMTLWEVDIT